MDDGESANRFVISDEFWALIQPHLPRHKNTHRFGGGRPRTPDRPCMNAIFFVLRTGCQWNALNATGLCASSTAHDRFQQWVKAGVFLRLWKAGLLAYDQATGIDWSWLSLDGAMTKSPLSGEKMWTESNRPRQGGGQAFAADRGRGRSGGTGCGRSQSPRHADGA
jgi:putative transposase